MALPGTLHLVVNLTRQCNFRCDHCVVDFADDAMGPERAQQVADFCRRAAGAFPTVSVEFLGGEPLLEFAALKSIVHALPGEKYRFGLITNGSLLTRERAAFIEPRFARTFLSFNAAAAENPAAFLAVASRVVDKSKYWVTYVYQPRYGREANARHVRAILGAGFSGVNLLPVVVTSQYSDADLADLAAFLAWAVREIASRGARWEVFDCVQENRGHAELMVDPDGTIYADTMGNLEKRFGMPEGKRACPPLGHIWDADPATVASAVATKDVSREYFKSVLSSGRTAQTWENLAKVSALIAKFNRLKPVNAQPWA